MVVFTCQHCGSALHKNKVEKHYNFECKKAPFITCVDCLKDFRGNEYVAHTQCMTEEQRYGGKNYVAKEPTSVKKRASWLSSVESALETPNLPTNQTELIKRCLQFSNIPNKRNKFHNFIKSSFGRSPKPDLVDQVFNLLEETHKKNLENEKLDNDNKTNKTVGNINGSSELCNDKSVDEDQNSQQDGESGDLSINEEKKNKKNKKKKSLEPGECNMVTDENNTSSNGVKNGLKLQEDSNGKPDMNGVEDISEEPHKKLSKKEKRELKKLKKHEAKLNENEQCEQEEKGNTSTNVENHDNEPKDSHQDDECNEQNIGSNSNVKKKNKEKSLESDECNMIIDENNTSSNSLKNGLEIDDKPDTNGVDDMAEDPKKKLSKKEKKALKKRKKYEAEINEIEQFKKDEEMEEDTSMNVEENDKDTSKKKNDNKIGDNDSNHVTNLTENSKKKKRQLDENGPDEPVSKKSKKNGDSCKLNETLEPDCTKEFKMDEIIIKVLESRSDKELPVKRLTKKIICEYRAINGDDHMTDEKLLSKFNKKVHKIPGVKVLKDKVKLLM